MSDEMLRRVWERMAAVFPNVWRAAMGDSPNKPDGGLTVAGDTWAKGLSGITGQQLAVGLRAVIANASNWPPTLGEFRALCEGLPTFEDVEHELRPGRSVDPSPFARLVWQMLDSWAYRHADVGKAERLLRGAYHRAREHVQRGGAMPETSAAVTQERPASKRDPAVAERALAAIAAAIGVDRQSSNTAPGAP